MTLIPYPASNAPIALNPWTAPVWEAAGEGQLVAPRCIQCGRFRMQPTPFCPHCQSQAVDWPILSGWGTLYSYTVLKHPTTAGAVYAPAVVELDDAPGIRLVSNIVEADPEQLHIGMVVEAVFHPLDGGLGITVFRPPPYPSEEIQDLRRRSGEREKSLRQPSRRDVS